MPPADSPEIITVSTAVINNAMLLRYEPIAAITEAVADQMLGIGIKERSGEARRC